MSKIYSVKSKWFGKFISSLRSLSIQLRLNLPLATSEYQDFHSVHKSSFVNIPMGISEMEKMSGESQLGGVNFRINFSHPCKFILVYIPSFCSSNSHTLHLHHFQIFFKNFMQRYVQYWWSEQLKVLKVSDLVTFPMTLKSLFLILHTP